MAKGVAFQEFDVTQDSDALEDLIEVHRSRITPTIVIDGRVIIGFDREELDKLLPA